MKKQIYFLGLFLILCMACSGEKSGETSAPDIGNVKQTTGSSNVKSEKYLLDITPKNADKNSMFGLTAKGFYLQDAKIEWLVNGNKILNAEKYSFKAERFKKGDIVQAVAIVKDIRIASDSIRIKNTPPQIDQLAFEAKRFKQGNKLGVGIAVSDIDGDQVTFIYEWEKNGEPAGNYSLIDSYLKRGDKIGLKVIPFDGEDYGTPRFLRTEIYNFSPIIEAFEYEKGNTFCQIKAVDPDGDPLTYSLKEAPQGMTIDKSTGFVKWGKPVGDKGKVSFTVSVVDSYGSEKTQELTLEVD